MITVKILGKQEFAKTLKRKGNDILKAQGAAIAKSARLVEAHAKRSIDRNGNWRTYIKPDGKIHKSSRPGTPPATDDGNLIDLITHKVKKMGNKWIGIVRSEADYSMALEFGTRKMFPRPFMGPALVLNIKAIREILRKALNKAIKKGLKPSTGSKK